MSLDFIMKEVRKPREGIEQERGTAWSAPAEHVETGAKGGLKRLLQSPERAVTAVTPPQVKKSAWRMGDAGGRRSVGGSDGP